MANRKDSSSSRASQILIPRDRRALSPIFATLIILAVVTVLFIPVFIWATGVASQNQESWLTSGVIATERIVIEEVNLRASQTNCTIYVRNIGKTAVTISNVIIQRADGTGQTYTYQGGAIQANRTSVVQGELITVFIPTIFSPTASTTYNIKVDTTRGVSDQYQAVA